MDYESGLVKPATQIDERWLRRLKHAPDRVAARLVIFPHAGGSASYFRPMEQFLHPQIDVLAVQYPGRQDRRREPCLTSVNALVDGVLPALKQLTGCPLALFGHSLGVSPSRLPEGCMPWTSPFTRCSHRDDRGRARIATWAGIGSATPLSSKRSSASTAPTLDSSRIPRLSNLSCRL